MPLKKRDVETQLRNKFHFTQSKVHSSDHIWLERRFPGRAILRTRLSHSNKELRAPLIKIMARQLGVQSQFFEGMIECSNSEEDFRQAVAPR
jgi:hypothetical protein